MNHPQHLHRVLRNAGAAAVVICLATGCATYSPVFIPQGTTIDTPATILVEIDRRIEVDADKTINASVVVKKIGSFDVDDTRMSVDVRLDPILHIARLQAWQLVFTAGDDTMTRPIDGFLVDVNGLAEFDVQCKKKKTKSAPNGCAEAVLLPRKGPVTTILLAPFELGGTTLMGKS